MTAPDVPTSAVDGPEVAAEVGPDVAGVAADEAEVVREAVVRWFDGTRWGVRPEFFAGIGGYVLDALAPLFAAERDRAVAEFAADAAWALGRLDFALTGPWEQRKADAAHAARDRLRTAAAERGAAQPPTARLCPRGCGGAISIDAHGEWSCYGSCGGYGGSDELAAQPPSNAADVPVIAKAALWSALAEVWEDEPSAAEWELAGVMASRAIEFFDAVMPRAALAQSPVPLTGTAEAVAGDE